MAQCSGVGRGGRKRPAEEFPDEDQPLAKKFGRLHIDPVATYGSPEKLIDEPLIRQNQFKPDDAMILDDTKHTIYIHDIEQDLAESEPPKGSITILPGLDDKLSISRLLARESKPQCNELVLYRPLSLTLSKEEDGQKALLETAGNQSNHHCEAGDLTTDTSTALSTSGGVLDGYNMNYNNINMDDVMDIDSGS